MAPPPEVLVAETNTSSYDSFRMQLNELTGATGTVSVRGLFNRLRDPEGYVVKLNELAQDAGPSVEKMGWSRSDSRVQRLRASRYSAGTIKPEDEKAAFGTLPALVSLHLALENHQYVETFLVRWTDLDRQEVFQLDFHHSNGMAGPQLIQSAPRPINEGSRYQVDVFDAREQLTFLGGTTISIGSLNSSATFQSAMPSPR